MTVYVVPCGVSVLDALRLKAKQGPADAKPRRLAETAAEWGRGVLSRRDGEVVTWWATQTAEDAARAKITAWDPRVLCAETSTLALSSGVERLGDLLDRGDHILLLASDTERGVASALCVAQHVAGPELPGIAYVSTPPVQKGTSFAAELGPGTLTIVHLSGLDPRHAEGGFVSAIAGIGRVLGAAFDIGEMLEVHLTGGFKATLLHTLAMTEVLYSQAPDRVRAVYVFEDAAAADAAVTPIGMRRFSREYIDDMRDELGKVRDRDVHLGAETFKGMAWTERDGLNAFGYGYLAVLGERVTPGRPGPT